MTVKFSSEQEREELEERKAKRGKVNSQPTWEFYRTSSLVEAVHKAREMGWEHNKVQVRKEVISHEILDYIIEPYEEGCSCRGLLDFENFFLREEDARIPTEM